MRNELWQKIAKCRLFCFGLYLDCASRDKRMYVGGAAGLGGEHWVDWIIIPLPPQEIKKVSMN